jgi:O-acetyl-ADP-ribose deacetylase (regulator of RNase III)
MIEFLQGDITKQSAGLIIHGVNCQGAMGSGVALAIKTKWPAVYSRYIQKGAGKQLLGTVDFIVINEDLVIGNCYTQEYFGPGDRKYADVGAVKSCLTKVEQYARDYQLTVKSPLMAAGLAGLDWNSEVYPIYEAIFGNNFDVDCIIFKF